LNLGHLDFDIVSTARCPAENFELRISDFASLDIFTTVENPLQIALFMQNKPNFRKSQMNVNNVLTKDYEKRTLGERGKNKPNSNPIHAKTQPIKANTKPIKANKMPKQTQFKPNPYPERRRRALPQSRHTPQLPTAEIKALLWDYRIRLFYLICMQRIEYGARNDCGQSLFEGQGLCGKTIRVVYQPFDLL